MKNAFYLIMSGLLILLVCSMNITMANAGSHEMSGKATMTYTKKEVVPIGDTEGHIIMLGVSSGLNANTGNWDFMDGGTATTRSTADLTKGNGPQEGYFTLSKDGNETVAKYKGVIKTVLSPDGKPMTSFSGDWDYIKCAGAYEGCTGEGTYQGYFTTENDYVVEYKGTLNK
jgi:hypothetical protein